ncbi:LacI family DNA-binding transcriptional regulator [Arachidicoccus ginsenosidivorans]|jgi:LacI family transcriptional regulator|uniref:LacI family transcriptional regulator n=1 Tax=Arachidicoccus ginsenosidivorans TaxID=496057 RepID=A0A5B8VNU4_9BACT|nr:LacI family DNA-binding transcriptional regulator [Arachidicoccus ginsenosidivorans]QEC72336.1 LacI family transcriptional regulator [Arachidicoccus ginsenosidivorans]
MSKQATIKEIAKKLGVSISTVSRALHDHPSIGLRTKMRVQEVAKELNYEPNQAAIQFKMGKTFTLGVILPELTENFFSQAISGIEDVAFENNYNVLFGQSHDDVEKEKQILATFIKNRIDGLLVSLSKSTRNIEHFQKLSNYNIPVVFFDRVPKEEDTYTVSCDLFKSSIKIVDFLWDQGHRHIALLKGPQTLTATNERMRGFMEGLSRKRAKTDPSLFSSSDLTKESSWSAMKDILSQKNRPTAVIAFNDYVALDAMQYVKRHTDLVINKDICFVSYSNLPMRSYLDTPPLVSIEQFPYEQGRKATEMLMAVMNGEDLETKQIVLDGELIALREE